MARIAGAGVDQHSIRASAEGWFISSCPNSLRLAHRGVPALLDGCRLLQQYLQIFLRERCRISEDELTADLKISPFARALTAVSRM